MEKEIKKILININSDCKKIDYNTDLINNGLIDSLGFLILISELEKKFKKKINTKKFNTSEFRSIRKIKSILEK
ncbi:phosphopantetheine-binding protein [Candidatus Pelagibacter bacterium nBUS_44]|uniref:phosphopantetheine-binding protein n=1 Tax=Candidatus Pelagibacter bacterium nBUS_44 TaxID=3374195 RepID=UPI003EBC8026